MLQGYIWLYSPKHKGRNVKEVSKLLVRCNNVWSLAGGTPLRVFLVVMLPCGKVPCAPGYFFCHETEEKHILGHVHSWSLGFLWEAGTVWELGVISFSFTVWVSWLQLSANQSLGSHGQDILSRTPGKAVVVVYHYDLNPHVSPQLKCLFS